jgi:hypothetical protein
MLMKGEITTLEFALRQKPKKLCDHRTGVAVEDTRVALGF